MNKLISVCLIILLLWLQGLWIQYSQAATPNPMIPLLQDDTSQGICNELQVVLIVDQSGSMSGTGGASGDTPTDPNGLRFDGPEIAVDILGSLRYQAYQTATVKVAVVYFGTQAQIALDWTELDADNESAHNQLLADLAAAFSPREQLGDTNVLAAFQFAESLFNQVEPQVGPCPARGVIFITDGVPYVDIEGSLPDSHMNQVQNYVLQYMSPTNHRIYVIGLDQNNQYWDRYQPRWADITNDIDRTRRAANQAEFTSLMFRFVTEMARSSLRVTGAEATVQCVPDNELQVPPFVQQMRFILTKLQPNIHIELYDPDGQLVDASQPGIELEGFDDPIESLTINNPDPGVWRNETPLTAGVEACEIFLISFAATGRLLEPDPNDTLIQFQRTPIRFGIVNSASGDPLPTYDDPRYNLTIEATLTGANGSDIPLTLNPQAGEQEVRGEAILVEAGPYSLKVTATSQYPNGSQYVVIDELVGNWNVQPLDFAALQAPQGFVEQYQPIDLQYGFVANGQPVTMTIPANISLTLTAPNGDTQPLLLNQGDNGIYNATFEPNEPGDYTLTSQALVQTLPGRDPVILEASDLNLTVLPIKLVDIAFVNPSGSSLVMTNWYFQNSGLDLQIQLVDENGNEVAPGEVGVDNPLAPFDFALLNANTDSSQTLSLNATGQPGLYRLTENQLGPARYEIQILPKADLGQGYAWTEATWSKTINGQINPWAFGLVGLVVAVFALAAFTGWRAVQLRRHPLTGHVHIFEQRLEESLDGVSSSYPFTILKEELPSLNRAVITGASGIVGLLQRVPVLDNFFGSVGPIKKLIVISPNQTYSDNKRAVVEVVFMTGLKQKIELSPLDAPQPLPGNYLIEKGPRAYSNNDYATDDSAYVSDTFFN